MIRLKGTLAAVAALMLTGGLMAAVPAQSAVKWSEPDQMNAKFGSDIQLSDNGKVAAWIRTNESAGEGPIQTSVYKGSKKGWAKAKKIPGTAESTGLFLTGDGNNALIEAAGTGYLLAQRRSGTNWSSPTPLVTGGTRNFSGRMSADGKTVVWVDFGEPATPAPPALVKARTRTAAGAWGPVVTVGITAQEAYDYGYRDWVLTLSRNGTTLLWIDETFALRGATRASDGTWTDTTKIKQYTWNQLPIISASLSADGTRLVYGRSGTDGILTSTRQGSTWSAVDTVTVAETSAPALTPNGKTLAYSKQDGSVLVRTWTGSKWSKVKRVGNAKTSSPTPLAMNKAVAWAGDSGLRVSTPKKGKWQSSVKIAKAAVGPVLSYNSKVLAWGSEGSKKLFSVHR